MARRRGRGDDAAPDIACVASKVLDWDGETIDFVDAALSFYGQGFKLHVGEPADDRYDEAHDVLFATGAAMVVRTDVFRSAGGFDERYFMFFEDVDFGWRLWLLGWRVHFVPHSVVFHRHHASMAKFKNWREQYLLERNALYTIYKNYDDHSLARALPAALALSVRRGVALGGVDPHTLDIERGIHGEADDLIPMPKSTMASVYRRRCLRREHLNHCENRATRYSAVANEVTMSSRSCFGCRCTPTSTTPISRPASPMSWRP